MDEDSNRSQHMTLFEAKDDHEKRISKLEADHSHMVEKLGLVCLGALFILDKMGVWDKLA